MKAEEVGSSVSNDNHNNQGNLEGCVEPRWALMKVRSWKKKIVFADKVERDNEVEEEAKNENQQNPN